MSRHVRRSYDHPLTLKLSDPPLKFCCVKLQKSFGRAFFFFSLSKRRPLQRCVSMPQTDMCWSTHTYQICFQIVPLHMRNSEYSSPSPSLRSCLLEGGARRQVCPRGFGATRVCNWHQKSRAWSHLIYCLFTGAGKGRVLSTLWESRCEDCVC